MEICRSVHQVTDDHQSGKTREQHTISIRGDYSGLSVDLKMTHPATIPTARIVNVFLDSLRSITGETIQPEFPLYASARVSELSNLARHYQSVDNGFEQACQIAMTAKRPITLAYIGDEMGGISKDRAHALIVAMLALELITEMSTDGDYQPGKYKPDSSLPEVKALFKPKPDADGDASDSKTDQS